MNDKLTCLPVKCLEFIVHVLTQFRADRIVSQFMENRIDTNHNIDTLVLGIGNILWADEGFGVRAVENLHAQYRFPFDVRVMDGGTQGMFLLPYVCAASKLLIFDAIDFGLTPGELHLIKDDDVPQYLGAKKISMHQTGFQEVLASAKLTNKYPSRLALIGVQPEKLDDYGGSLRPKIKDRIPQAVEIGITVLKAWGIHCEKREDSLSKQDQLRPEQLALAAYESAIDQS